MCLVWGKANSLRKESKVVLRALRQQALWSAAACCRFPRERACSRPFGRVSISGQQAGLKKSGSKLPLSSGASSLAPFRQGLDFRPASWPEEKRQQAAALQSRASARQVG